MLKKCLVTIAFFAALTVVAELHYPSKIPKVVVADGKRDFERYCKRCHSIVKDEVGLGPSLYGISNHAASRVVGQNAYEYLWTSILDPSAYKASEGVMPSGIAKEIGRERVFQILAYIMSQDGEHHYRSLWYGMGNGETTESLFKINEIWSIEKLNRGRSLFFGKGKCADCHTLNAVNLADHLFAPDLAGVGVNDDMYLEASIRNPSGHVTSGYAFGRAIIEEDIITGRLIVGPREHVILNRESLGYSSYAFDPLTTNWEESKSSMMPAYDLSTLNVNELSDLIAFLKALR